MSRPAVPKIDARKASDLLRQLRSMAPHYTREWTARDDTDPGVALLRIFSTIAQGVISRLNRAPDRNFLAFLDLLGIRLLPKTPAHAPVRFLVATGTEVPFLVARKTQVTAAATANHPELPFETTEDLSVIPAALVSLVATDPEKDRIYKPPPAFLELQLAASELPPLIVQAFSAAGSKVLQLDPPGQVAEGDFLRIEQTAESVKRDDCLPVVSGAQTAIIDHLVVSGPPKGAIVTVSEPLARDYAEDTQVKKVTRFELFEGKNFQEHVLFLGHADYFAIKSEAQIELRVEHAGSFASLPRLNLAWEFFGVTDVPKTEDGWHALEVESDGTAGLSRPGRILLRKPAGEIKELEINGTKNRWIRARLKDPLPATPPPPLPRVESVSMIVSSGATLPADQAFNNDTPLTTTTPFNPFGLEPRLFDRFYVASEEAFSKPGAEVTLDAQLDFTDLLASPGAIFHDGRVKAFAHGAAGKLVEFQIDPVNSQLKVFAHGTPTNRRLLTRGIPAVVQDGNGKIGVAVRTDDDTVHLRHIPTPNDATWNWVELKGIAGKLDFNPAAVSYGDIWVIFVVANKRVFIRLVDPREPNRAINWNEVTSQGDDPRPVVASTPFPVTVTVDPDRGAEVWILVTDESRHTWLHNGVTWKDITPSDEFLSQQNARPFAVPTEGGFRVFLRSSTNELISFTAGDRPPLNLESPPGVNVDSDPFVFISSFGPRAFVRGSDNQLWERDLELEGGKWTQHENSLDVVLADQPFVVGYNVGGDDGAVLSVLSTSNKNSLLEFRSRLSNIESGQLSAGPAQILMLGDRLGRRGTLFINVTAGAGSDPFGDATRKIINADNKTAILEEPLDEVPDETSNYDVYLELETGNVPPGSDEEADGIVLDEDTRARVGNFIYLRKPGKAGQLRQIMAIDDAKASVDPAWDLKPIDDDPYSILAVLQPDQTALSGSARRVVLPDGPHNVIHPGLFIEVETSGGQKVTREIKSFSLSTRVVEVTQDFPSDISAGADYRITVGDVDEGWQAYRDPDQTELRPDLSWEYWNGRGWVALKLKEDNTDDFLIPGTVKFTLPGDLAKTEVVGQESFWIRSRIVGGDYGRELFEVDKDGRLITKKDPIRPPLIKALNISYTLQEQKFPQVCLTLNSLNYLDQTAANLTADKFFLPYQPLDDNNKALYFGFDRSFEGGPVRIYIAAKELPVDEQNKPKLNWEFAFENDWAKLFAEDRTEAFTRPDSVGLTVPLGFQNSQQFGSALFWIRATLLEGSWSQSPLLSGVFPNTVETIQARTILNEILGSSNATRHQRFRFQQLPVLEGEEIRVRESLTEQELTELVNAEGEDAVLAIRDQQDRVMETWIKWREVQEFFDSGPNSRHYRLDRASGELEFGNNIHGRIPPAGGDNIVAFAYQAGGGAGGNVAAGEIKSPVTAVAGVDSVINPMPAGGGSEAATPEDMLEIGPAQISNRSRAVTTNDFENLALEASREVAKARCLANRNANGRSEIGWTSIHLVPHSKDKTPQPSLELRRAVSRYLASRADLTMIDEGHLFIGPPEYVPINVDVTVFAKSLDAVARAELSVRQKLDQFLHPLTGGVDGTGWDFGRDLAASDIYRLLEDIDEVDHIEKLRLSAGDAETITVGNAALIASGTHTIRMGVAN
jgi:baseplate J-like protein